MIVMVLDGQDEKTVQLFDEFKREGTVFYIEKE